MVCGVGAGLVQEGVQYVQYLWEGLAAYDSVNVGYGIIPMGDYLNRWTTIDLGTSLLVARRVDPLKSDTPAELAERYDLLTAMKAEELQNQFYAEGAALEHALDDAALNTYSAGKIKKTV